jgi:hypothetical protein
MREVVTVQVGGHANFVGSHFWNFQVPAAPPQPYPLLSPTTLYLYH